MYEVLKKKNLSFFNNSHILRRSSYIPSILPGLFYLSTVLIKSSVTQHTHRTQFGFTSETKVP